MNSEYNRAEGLIENNGVAGADNRKRRFLKTMIFAVTGFALFAYLCFAGEGSNLSFTDGLDMATKVRKTDGTCRRIHTPDGAIYLILDGKAHHVQNPTVWNNLFRDWSFESATTLPYPTSEVLGESTRLIIYPGSAAVYLSINGKVLRHIADPETYDACNFDWGKIINGVGALLPVAAKIDVNNYIESSKNECKIFYVPSRSTTTIGVYIVVGNTVRQFIREADWTNVMNGNYKTLPVLPSLPNTGLKHGSSLFNTALERDSDGKVYLVSWYDKQYIANMDTLNKCGFNAAKIRTMYSTAKKLPTLSNIDIYAY
jgi:hypothetical protein